MGIPTDCGSCARVQHTPNSCCFAQLQVALQHMGSRVSKAPAEPPPCCEARLHSAPSWPPVTAAAASCQFASAHRHGQACLRSTVQCTASRQLPVSLCQLVCHIDEGHESVKEQLSHCIHVAVLTFLQVGVVGGEVRFEYGLVMPDCDTHNQLMLCLGHTCL